MKVVCPAVLAKFALKFKCALPLSVSQSALSLTVWLTVLTRHHIEHQLTKKIILSVWALLFVFFNGFFKILRRNICLQFISLEFNVMNKYLWNIIF